MKKGAVAGFMLLGAVWAWLAWIMLSKDGLTLKDIIIVVMSSIIVFVPLWKRYGRKGE